MALFLLLSHFSCSAVSKFLFTILNFYTYKFTLVPQALISIFKIEFWVVTAIATVALFLSHKGTQTHFWERVLQTA